MIVLLLTLLLAPSIVGAEAELIDGHWYGDPTVDQCPAHQTCRIKGTVLKPEAFPCYQRMQEAMRRADAYFKHLSDRIDTQSGQSTFAVWTSLDQERFDTVMHECVKEAP